MSMQGTINSIALKFYLFMWRKIIYGLLLIQRYLLGPSLLPRTEAILGPSLPPHNNDSINQDSSVIVSSEKQPTTLSTHIISTTESSVTDGTTKVSIEDRTTQKGAQVARVQSSNSSRRDHRKKARRTLKRRYPEEYIYNDEEHIHSQ
jgi:hypothetical protein